MLLDEGDVRARAREYAESFDGGDVFYAARRSCARAVARWMDEAGLGLDVCTGGENWPLRCGPDSRPSGSPCTATTSRRSSSQRAVDAGVGRIVVDSLDEIARLAGVAAASRRCPSAGAGPGHRRRRGPHPRVHRHRARGPEVRPVHRRGRRRRRYRRGARRAPSLELVGLHSHIGSQIFDTAAFEVAAHRVVALLATVRDDHGLELPEIDLGGGLGIAYVAGDDPEPIKSIAGRLRAIVERECASYGLAVPRLSVEPGRALIGPAGITVYEVGTVKPVRLDAHLTRTYVSVDGGMSDNIRTALYDADYTVVLASRGFDGCAGAHPDRRKAL